MKDEPLTLWEFTVERQRVWHNRNVLKLPRDQWTEDPILSKYHFCNVYRELDKTTQSLFKAFPLSDYHDPGTLLFNVFILRTFNSAHLLRDLLISNPYRFDREKFVEKLENIPNFWNTAYLTCPVPYAEEARGKGKHVNYSYALEHVARLIADHNFCDELMEEPDPKRVIKRISAIKLYGPFIAYQIALDLSYYPGFFAAELTENDFLVIGPGAAPTLRMFGYEGRLEEACRSLWERHYPNLTQAAKGLHTSWEDIAWRAHWYYPKLTLSAIEFLLCEYRKYRNFVEGRGRKRLYHSA